MYASASTEPGGATGDLADREGGRGRGDEASHERRSAAGRLRPRGRRPEVEVDDVPVAVHAEPRRPFVARLPSSVWKSGASPLIAITASPT